MNCEASFNHRNEPCIILTPENSEEVRILTILRNKSKGIEGNHVLVCGSLEEEGQLVNVSIVTNQIGHPTTIRESL